MNRELKRYLISSGITFLSYFLLALSVNIGTLDLDNITWAAIGGVVIVALRAAIKAVVEYLNKIK